MTRLSPVRAYIAALVLMTVGLIGLVGATGLPWLILAVVLGVVATRGWGRTVVGALIAVSGVGAALLCILGSVPGSAVIGGASGVLLALGGAWTVIAGRAWPAMGARYDAGRPSSRRVRTMSPWEAQDHGLDPTEDPSDGRRPI